ncbi:hypothetical protein E1757_24610 [Paenibacillus piri]|uniref:Transcription initiation factor TFIID n=1 Tax=Paenibacillus piri TaxID=2547395 RepID=A0A4R5KHH3_9BACL|nr:hypothetical protein E1757_24610 [Paenibacillus piri]
MKGELDSFSKRYAAGMDNAGREGDERRSINHPVVFVFLGDQSAEALGVMHRLNAAKWNNSAGVVYLQLGTKHHPELDNVYGWSVPSPTEHKLELRPAIRKQFYTDDAKLLELNVTLRRMNSRISEFGRMYTHLQRLNIAVVTRLDDPFNVLLPEITVLMETIFGEQFRSVVVDLYGLLEEKSVGDEFAYRASLGVGFLRELDRYQSRDFKLEAMLQLTGEGVRLPAVHTPSPLFDMVYLLSDKDERGIFGENGMQGNYEAICNLNLLKNRKSLNEQDPLHGVYNNQHFKQNATPPDGDGRSYASAGFAKVTRPNQAIALTVLYHAYLQLLERMKDNAQTGLANAAELLELESPYWDRDIRSLLPEPQRAVEGMFSLLHDAVSMTELRTMTLRQAETALYGTTAQLFFDSNVLKRLEEAFRDRRFGERLRTRLDSAVIGQARYGFYSACLWTSSEQSGNVLDIIREQAKETAKLLEQGRSELEQLYAERVDRQPFAKMSFWDRMTNKASLKSFTRPFLELVYGLKLELLLLEMKLRLLNEYEHELEEQHDRSKLLVERFHLLEKMMLDASRGSISVTSDYLGRNINEYYGRAVQHILTEAENRRGAQFYFEERYMGNVSLLLARQDEAFVLQRLIELTDKEIFNHPVFQKPFEDELLERANVTAGYDSRDVLSKEELFRDLYGTLESEAAIRADVYNSTHKHRYEEKYFFGDFDSEFIRFAFAVDQGSRTYKLGCVQELKRSGIEKLNVMGGFRIEDLMYYRNGRRYYDTYVQNGYVFHGIDL